MNTRAAYLTQILDKIGAPLMQSLTGNLPIEGAPDIAAEKLAELIAKTVELSIQIGETAKLNTPENDDDSIRIALAALAAPLIGGHFNEYKTPPSDNDLKKIVAGLGAALSFSENFTSMNETAKTLEGMDMVQANLPQLQFINAFVPVITAVAKSSFDQDEKELASSIISKLTARAETIIEDLSAEEQKSDKRMVVNALARIYAECHNAEITRLKQNDNADTPSIENVWKAFEPRAQMLDVLCGSIAGIEAPVASPVATPVVAKEPPPTETQDKAPTAENTAPSSTETPIKSEAPKASGNPMAMFAKPKNDAPTDSNDDEVTPPPAPSAPAPEATAPAPSPETSDTDVKTEEPEPPKSPMGGGGPMSFFKTPPKSDDDEDDT